jgi:hypothetical protein
MAIAATAVEKTTARVRDIMVVPQLRNGFAKVAIVYAAKSKAAEVRRGILNASGRFLPVAKNLLTMREA